jgi:hypothetical protein
LELSDEDNKSLQIAFDSLENPGFAARLTNFVGAPIEKGMEMLPDKMSASVTELAHSAINKTLDVAISTMDKNAVCGTPSSDGKHKLLVSLSGAAGGAFGLAAMAIELPISTTIMMRSIADIARSEGENIRLIETQLACIEVFALGGKSTADDGAETGYYAVRSMLAKSVSEAAKYIAQKGIAEEGAPVVVRLISKVATRYGIQISEKAAAQAVPILGAAGGAIINLVFIDHFQDMARGHFIVRRLERKYGNELIQLEYERLKGNTSPPEEIVVEQLEE